MGRCSIRKSGAVKVGLHTCQVNWIPCVPNEISTLYSELFPNFSHPNDGLADCPEDYTSVTAPKISSWTTERYGLMVANNWNQMNFSINRVEEENDSKSTAGNFVARYCVPDPCTTSGCIRKCCPSDMALVMKYYHDLSPISKCDEPHPKPLNLSLYVAQSAKRVHKCWIGCYYL